MARGSARRICGTTCAGVTKLMLWQPRPCIASIIAASRFGVTGSPHTCQEMSKFWQNTHRRLQPAKKIVPEPFQPRRQSSSPKCGKSEATTAWRPIPHKPRCPPSRLTLHSRGQTPHRSGPSNRSAISARAATPSAPRPR